MSTQPAPPVRYGPTLVVGLVGAVAATVGVAKPWATATAQQAGLPTIEVTVSGADLVPLASALSVVVLAAFGAVIATKGWVRRGLGLLIVVASVVVLFAAVRPPGADSALRDALSAKGWSGGDYVTSTDVWRWVALAGAVLSILAGIAISRYGDRWATMGREYDAPGPGGAADSTARDATLSEAEVWREIDQGRDPTHRDGA